MLAVRSGSGEAVLIDRARAAGSGTRDCDVRNNEVTETVFSAEKDA